MRAAGWLQGAKRALEDERWDDAVYNAQMCVEHSAKAVLLLEGIDYPKAHDVSQALLRLKAEARVPAWFRQELEMIAQQVSELAEVRDLAGYGFERGIGKEYFRELAPETVKEAGKIHKLCEKMIRSQQT